jgi:hypothetical protein
MRHFALRWSSVILASSSLVLLLRATAAFSPPDGPRWPPKPPSPCGTRRGRWGAAPAPPARAVPGREGACRDDDGEDDHDDDGPQRGGGSQPTPVAATAARPRLALAVEVAIRRVAAAALLRSCGSLEVEIRASSNLALLRGEIDLFSASAWDVVFRCGILGLRRADVRARDVRLGCLPLILPLSPFLLWRLRRHLWSAALVATLLPSSRPALRRAWVRLWRALGARPSTVGFSLTVAEDDVGRSLALRHGLRAVLRSLVENSVVGAAAALVDDARGGGGGGGGWGGGKERDRRRRGGRGGLPPLLPGGRAGAANDDALALFPKRDLQQQRQGLASALLSATTFELKKTLFADGRIVLRGEATVPNEDAAAGDEKRVLPFAIRARLEPASSADATAASRRPADTGGWPPRRGRRDALGFASPDCRLNTGPLTAGTVLGRLIPDVLWVPFGPGVVVPLGWGFRIHRAEVAREADGDGRGEVCRIDGSLTAFATEDDSRL